MPEELEVGPITLGAFIAKRAHVVLHSAGSRPGLGTLIALGIEGRPYPALEALRGLVDPLGVWRWDGVGVPLDCEPRCYPGAYAVPSYEAWHLVQGLRRDY